MTRRTERLRGKDVGDGYRNEFGKEVIVLLDDEFVLLFLQSIMLLSFPFSFQVKRDRNSVSQVL